MKTATLPSLRVDPELRSAGYMALFEIDGQSQVTVLAVRHQREDDYL